MRWAGFVLPPTPVETLTLPAPAPEPARPPFPWIATIAPVVVSVALWAVTSSPFGLLFAALGPVVAVGGVIDGARSRRRAVQRDGERFRAAVARTEATIDAAHARERLRLAELAQGGWDGDRATLPVRVGTGDAPGVLRPSGSDSDDPMHEGLVRRAATVPHAPVIVDAVGGAGVVGPPVVARAVARSLVLQLAARIPPAPGELMRPADENWADSLPHATSAHEQQAFSWVDGPSVAWAEHEGELPPGCAVVVDAARAHALTVEQAHAGALVLADRARVLGLRPSDSALPAAVSWDDVSPAAAGAGLSAVVGVDEQGVVPLDLVSDGPHALVAGTTGSGKSELLVSWVLGMALGRAPAEVTFLLVDFKGGAAFAPLAGLPHVVATLSDLDARLTHRAVESLRAELLRREKTLADRGARAIDELPAGVLPRLVVVVDEFAALVSARPELHDVVADVAARGRSLGMHLVLCTQRPAGVVRDAVLANIGLRISLRVADRADSIAMLGDDAAARLPATPRGRAIVASPEGMRTIQVALAGAGSAARLADASAHHGVDPAVTHWCDPLPDRIDLDALPDAALVAARGLAFGLADLPAELRQPVAAHDPAAHGHLLVVGAAGAGATTVAITLAESARRRGMRSTMLSSDPADAWAQLAAPDDLRRSLLIVDGLDALLGAIDPDYRHEFAERLTAVLRDPSPGAARAVVTVRRLTGAVSAMTGLFGSRLVLRQASREDHVLAGGGHGDWDPDVPPGAGTWRGAPVQVALVERGSLPPPRVPPPARVTLGSHPVLAVVAARPRALADGVRAAGARVIEIGDLGGSNDLQVSVGSVPTVLIGDPDGWLGDWGLLTTARREWPIVLIGCTPADHRALLRGRDLPPLLGTTPGECWLVRDGRTERAVLEVGHYFVSAGERA